MAGDDDAAANRRPLPADTDPEAAAVYEAMEPLEPYTAPELAGRLDRPRRAIERLLDVLATADVVRKKPVDPAPVWVREPPAHACPDCGHEFEVKFLHAVLTAVRYCPECGRRLD
jgi:hypothetical protein